MPSAPSTCTTMCMIVSSSFIVPPPCPARTAEQAVGNVRRTRRCPRPPEQVKTRPRAFYALLRSRRTAVTCCAILSHHASPCCPDARQEAPGGRTRGVSLCVIHYEGEGETPDDATARPCRPRTYPP